MTKTTDAKDLVGTRIDYRGKPWTATHRIFDYQHEPTLLRIESDDGVCDVIAAEVVGTPCCAVIR